MDANEVIANCNTLKTFWSGRNKKFKEWYRLIQLVDELKTENMESFVGSDPQASFKLLRHLLDQPIPHKVPVSLLTEELMEPSGKLELLFDTIWYDIFAKHRRGGRQGWVWDLAGYMLATGWYSVFAIIPPDGTRCIAEVLNPATVFPQWASNNLAACARVGNLSPMDAKLMAVRNGWKVEEFKTEVPFYDYWRLDEKEQVYNSVVINKSLVKPDILESRLSRIPIFTAPVGGLPDTGAIADDKKKWTEEIGHACVATNEGVQKSMNKWWTFAMQLLRDTAQAIIKEKSRSGKPIVTPESRGKRGAIYRMTPEEDVDYLVPPPIPVEIRSMQLDMEAMMQRGGPSYAMFGNFSQPLTAYVMSQIAASTNQIAKPYHQGIVDCMTDIDNFFFEQMKNFSYKPYGVGLPAKLPDGLRLSADYEIRIPGDLIQRATVARMLDPDYRISYTRITSELFPEIKNPMKERAQTLADIAQNNPIRAMIALIESFRIESDKLDKVNDKVGARLYAKAADKLESQLDLAPESNTQPAQARRPIGNRTEALPPTGTTEAPTSLV